VDGRTIGQPRLCRRGILEQNVNVLFLLVVLFADDCIAPLALLTISPLTLSFPFALLTYLFVAHTIGAPNEAFGAALLAGGVTSLVGLFCVGLVRDA
jgi:hypothetical protein